MIKVHTARKNIDTNYLKWITNNKRHYIQSLLNHAASFKLENGHAVIIKKQLIDKYIIDGKFVISPNTILLKSILNSLYLEVNNEIVKIDSKRCCKIINGAVDLDQIGLYCELSLSVTDNDVKEKIINFIKTRVSYNLGTIINIEEHNNIINIRFTLCDNSFEYEPIKLNKKNINKYLNKDLVVISCGILLIGSEHENN